MTARSYLTAYLLFLTSAPFGLHLVYVSRPKQAVVWALTFGGFGFGILRDLFALPRYVREANLKDEERIVYRKNQIELGIKPPWSFNRVLLQCCIGVYFATVFSFLVPSPLDGEIVQDRDKVISNFLYALGLACGVNLVGSIGNEQVLFLQPFLVSILVALVALLNDINLFGLDLGEEKLLSDLLVVAHIVLVTYVSVRSRRYKETVYGEIDKIKIKTQSYWAVTSTLKHFLYLWAFLVLLSIGLYNYGMVSVKDKTGEKVRVPLHTLFEDAPSLDEIWEGIKQINFEDWKQKFEEYSSQKGIGHAFSVLGLNSDATPQQVKRKFRELSVTYHPDRNRGESPEKQKALEEHYIKITQAYETVKAYQSR